MPEKAARKRESVRVLVAEDYEPWRGFVRRTLESRPEYQIICEVSDGMEAVQKAQELHPDLIVLDISLPRLNGIEAGRRIRTCAPQSIILFLSENHSLDIAEEALRSGSGFVLKLDAASELALAVKAVLQGKRFVSSSLARMFNRERRDPSTGNQDFANSRAFIPGDAEAPIRHEVIFYSDDQEFLDDLTLFVGTALRGGNAAIVAATESHRVNLIPRLQAYGVHIARAIEQGRYLAFDASDALSSFLVKGMPDPILFMKTFRNLILMAGSADYAERPRITIFAECVHVLCAQGNPEAAIQLEKLGNQLTRTHDVNVFCGYCLSTLGGLDDHIFQEVCAEHSAVHGYESRF